MEANVKITDKTTVKELEAALKERKVVFSTVRSRSFWPKSGEDWVITFGTLGGSGAPATGEAATLAEALNLALDKCVS